MKTSFTLLLLLVSLLVNAQYQQETQEEQKQVKEKPSIKEKLYTGGNFGISGNFSDYISLRVSPLIGLKVSPKFYTGLGIEYIYTSDKRYTPDVSAHDYGARLFGQYNLIRELFAHAEFAGYNYDAYYKSSGEDRILVPYILLGGGYRKQISNRSFFSLRVLFDVLQDDNSPYKSGEPHISVGLGVGI